MLSSDLCQGKVQMSSIMLNVRRYIDAKKIVKLKSTKKYEKKNLKIRCVVLNKVINNQINDGYIKFTFFLRNSYLLLMRKCLMVDNLN